MEESISVAALAISIISLAYSYKVNLDNVIHDRKRDTLDAFNVLQCQVFDELNLYTKTQIEEICQNTRSEEYKKISTFLARIDHFSIGVNEKIYDKEIVRRLAGKCIKRSYGKLACMIAIKRKYAEKIEGADAENLYKDFENLALTFGYGKKTNGKENAEEKING